MRAGRPRKIRIKKSYKRKKYGLARRGAKNPKQIAAKTGRNFRRRRRR